jgi:hypothetical protein
MAEVQEERTWTYIADKGRYDANLLSSEGRTAFNMLLEVTAEVQTLQKRIGVLQAASIELNRVIGSHLTDDALLETLDTEEEEVA